MMPPMRLHRSIALVWFVVLGAACKDPQPPSKTASTSSATASASSRAVSELPTASEQLRIQLLDAETKKPLANLPVALESQQRKRCRPPECKPKRHETRSDGDGYVLIASDVFDEINRLEVRGYHVAHVSPKSRRVGLRRRAHAAAASASAASPATAAAAP
jgi:hypothetical protein